MGYISFVDCCAYIIVPFVKPGKFRIVFKLCLLTYRGLCEKRPVHLHSMLAPSHSSCSLKSTKESLCQSLGSRPTQLREHFTLAPLLFGTTSGCLSVQLLQLQHSGSPSRHTSLTWPFPQRHQPAWWPLMLWSCFIDLAVEHRFGCHTTEPGYTRDVDTIEIWLIHSLIKNFAWFSFLVQVFLPYQVTLLYPRLLHFFYWLELPQQDLFPSYVSCNIFRFLFPDWGPPVRIVASGPLTKWEKFEVARRRKVTPRKALPSHGEDLWEAGSLFVLAMNQPKPKNLRKGRGLPPSESTSLVVFSRPASRIQLGSPLHVGKLAVFWSGSVSSEALVPPILPSPGLAGLLLVHSPSYKLGETSSSWRPHNALTALSNGLAQHKVDARPSAVSSMTLVHYAPYVPPTCCNLTQIVCHLWVFPFGFVERAYYHGYDFWFYVVSYTLLLVTSVQHCTVHAGIKVSGFPAPAVDCQAFWCRRVLLPGMALEWRNLWVQVHVRLLLFVEDWFNTYLGWLQYAFWYTNVWFMLMYVDVIMG